MSHKLEDVIKDFSVDCVIFGFEKSVLEVLLIKRAIEPMSGMWALPGGFVKTDEHIQKAAERVLLETTGVEEPYLEEITIFDDPKRYPLWRVISIGYFALISPEHYTLTAGPDTTEVRWVPLESLPELPFDHNEIIAGALEKLRRRVRSKPIGFELLPKKFTLPQLQRLYEVILGKTLDKRNFRKKLFPMHFVKKLNQKESNNKRRAAFLYQFDKMKYTQLKKKGFLFDL
jgi:8-oxo-dGTP diphosphatase